MTREPFPVFSIGLYVLGMLVWGANLVLGGWTPFVSVPMLALSAVFLVLEVRRWRT